MLGSETAPPLFTPTATAWDLESQLPPPSAFQAEGQLARGRTAGIYLLLCSDEIVYVGQSVDIRSRLAQHRAERKKAFNRAVFYHLPDPQSRLVLESLLILLLRPRCNRALNLGISPGRIWEIRWPAGKRPDSNR